MKRSGVEGLKVSIVIPAYNQADYLALAIDAALTQTHPNIEVVVVNDGSTDNTVGIMDSYGSRIVCVHQENGGLPAARNAGLRQATGDFVHFLDSDDFIKPDFVARSLERINDPGESVVVVGSYCCVDGDGKIISDPVRPMDDPQDSLCAVLNRETARAFHTYLFPRAELVDIGGFEESMPALEDAELMMRHALKHGPRYVAAPLAMAYYRKFGYTMSSDPNKMWTGFRILRNKICKAIKADCPDKAPEFKQGLLRLRRTIYEMSIRPGLRNCRNRGMTLSGIQLLLKGAKIHPPSTLLEVKGAIRRLLVNMAGFFNFSKPPKRSQ